MGSSHFEWKIAKTPIIATGHQYLVRELITFMDYSFGDCSYASCLKDIIHRKGRINIFISSISEESVLLYDEMVQVINFGTEKLAKLVCQISNMLHEWLVLWTFMLSTLV